MRKTILATLLAVLATAPAAQAQTGGRGLSDVPYRQKATNPVRPAPMLPKDATDAQRRSAARQRPAGVNRTEEIDPMVAGVRRVQAERQRRQRIEDARRRLGVREAGTTAPR